MDRRKPWILPVLGGSLALASVAFLGREVAMVRARLASDRAEIAGLERRLEAEGGARAALAAQVADLGRRTGELERAVGEERGALIVDAGTSIRKLEEREAGVEARLAGLSDDLRTAARRVDAEAADIGEAKRRLHEIAPEDFSTLLSPTVKISSKSDVGSGTVIYSAKHGERYVSYVLTAHHIVEQNWDPKSPIPLQVLSFKDGRKIREENGVVVAVNQSIDLALIELDTETVYDAVAKMIAPERAGDVRLYSRVHALGCPLGYAPIPTSGELTTKTKVLDGQSYWMINAPTIFGNSGGGIYLADSGEMIGILSRISAYKNLIDVAVPHMGIVTSMPDVYGWLEHEHYQFLFNDKFSYDDCGKARLAARSGGGGAAAPVSGAVPAGTTAVKVE
jgi:hypothetical protein